MKPQSSIMTGITEPTLFHSRPWRDALEDVFDLQIREFTSPAEPDAFGLFSLLSDLRGDRIVSTPFSDFCDPTFETQTGWDDFADHLLSFNVPVTVKPFENKFALSDSRFEQRKEVLWHGIGLPDDFEIFWSSLSSSSRNRARKPAKKGIQIRQSCELVDYEKYHNMHVGLRKDKYRMLAQPFELFEALSSNFGSEMFVLLAEEAGEPIAGMVFFVWNGVAYYKFGASVEHPVACNRALFSKACEIGIELGLSLIDLGRSDLSQPGLINFKSEFASESVELSTLHWTPESWSNPQGAAAGATLGALTDLLTAPEVDPELTKSAGSLLYRYFA